MGTIRDTKDAIGARDTNKDISLKRVAERVLQEENASRFTTNIYGNSWIAGSSTNGLVGTNTNTQGGGQQVVGASGRTEAVVKVTNPNNVHRERFKFTRFEDTANTTGEWSSGSLVLNEAEVGQSLSVYLDSRNISVATLTIEGTGTDGATFALSNDGGSTFETVTPGVEHAFASPSNDLRWKITNNGSNGAAYPWQFAQSFGSTITITLIKIEYE